MARQDGTGHEVAIKQYRRKLTSKEASELDLVVDELKHFDNEYFMLYIDHYYDGSQYYLITEYVEGMNLGDLDESTLLDLPDEELSIVIDQLVDGITDLHIADLSSNDIKPSNVILTGAGIKYIDWGVYLEWKNVDKKSEWLTLAPEIIEGSVSGVHSDLWSLGN